MYSISSSGFAFHLEYPVLRALAMFVSSGLEIFPLLLVMLLVPKRKKPFRDGKSILGIENLPDSLGTYPTLSKYP